MIQTCLYYRLRRRMPNFNGSNGSRLPCISTDCPTGPSDLIDNEIMEF